MEPDLIWAAFAELDEAIAAKGCACVQTTHFDCALHRAFDRALDMTRARIEAMSAKTVPHVHSWGALKAIPPDGDLGRECDGCAEYQGSGR